MNLKTIRQAILFSGCLLSGCVFADIAPNPIHVNGIYTLDTCLIQMTGETVYADLYNDSSKVACTFELLNFGDSVTIQIGFPVMNFHYWSIEQYNEDDKSVFRISVNDSLLTEKDIRVPKEFESIYDDQMADFALNKEYARKSDSIYTANHVIRYANGKTKYSSPESYKETREALDALYLWWKSRNHSSSDLWRRYDAQMKMGNYPWYVWNVHFDKNEKKIIKVAYSLPSGLGYGSDYRYFKYILETGSGWYKEIENASIKLQLHDIAIETIEEINPAGASTDTLNKTIVWNLTGLEPTAKDDIYLRYYNPKERKEWEQYKKKYKRALRLRRINPVNWFR